MLRSATFSTQLGVADPDGLATQLTILVEGAMAAALVRDDPAMARAAKSAARVLLAAAGVTADDNNSTAQKPSSPRRTAKSLRQSENPGRAPRTRRR